MLRLDIEVLVFYGLPVPVVAHIGRCHPFRPRNGDQEAFPECSGVPCTDLEELIEIPWLQRVVPWVGSTHLAASSAAVGNT